MTSPLIDEEIMLQTFSSTDMTAPKTLERLRSGVILLLLDAFDRKVTRDQFVATLSTASVMADMLGKYGMMEHFKEHLTMYGEIAPADIEVTMASLLQQIETGAMRCTQLGEMLQACPLDEDRIN